MRRSDRQERHPRYPASPVGGANTSFTGQFGDKNTAATSQKSADGTSGFGQVLNPATATRPPTLQIGSGNEADTAQKSVGGKGQGVNNAAATLQAGNGQLRRDTDQGGHVSGAFGATPAEQAANFTNASFTGQFGSKNTAFVDQLNGANTQATFQVGFQELRGY